MTHTISEQKFGVYKPKGLDALTIKAAQWGLGHGFLKKKLYSLWQKRHPKSPVDVVYHGVKLRLQPHLNTIENKILFSAKKREGVELKHLEKIFSDGGVFLDIGANFGYYSLMAAKMGASQIIAVEPNPALHDRLNYIVALNNFDNKITAHCKALGAEKDTLELTLNPDDLGGSSMANPDMAGEKIAVPVVPLLSLLKDENIQAIDAMKIDVEGMEDRVLFPFFETAPKSLFPKLIIMEENASLWQRPILEWLLENHYDVVHKSHGNYILGLKN